MSTIQKVGVVIGRFQPIHCGHLNGLILPVLDKEDYLIIILGSAFAPLTFKNPWTWEQRMSFIVEALKAENIDTSRVHIIPTADRGYNQAWKLDVLQHVNNYIKRFPSPKVSLYGTTKKDTAWYLDLFSNTSWEIKFSSTVAHDLCATDVRQRLFNTNINYNKIDWTRPAYKTLDLSSVIPAIRPTIARWFDSPPGQHIMKLWFKANGLLSESGVNCKPGARQGWQDYEIEPDLLHTLE